VFAHIADAWPDAPVYTALYDARVCGDLVAPSRVRTSFLQRVPFGNRFFRALAPFYPAAFESLDLSAYDLVVSSTTAWAKGVRTAPGAVHVCYINTPSRFLFAYDRYVGGFGASTLLQTGLRTVAKPLITSLSAWDKRAAQRPTAFIANSRNVAERVREHYGRDAFVLHCPADVNRFTPGRGSGDYFLVLSRLLPYKAIDRAIDAAAIAGVKLRVAGTGPALEALRAHARGTTTEILGYVPDDRINALVGAARAVIVPGEEDFGLVPLEAAAAGRPALALRAGGALETIVEGETGAFFDEPSVASLASALRAFTPERYDPRRLRAHAEQFAPARFIERLRAMVGEIAERSQNGERGFVAPAGAKANGSERA
jgi:glycosyltransferase involved in cell wall biosynthesis